MRRDYDAGRLSDFNHAIIIREKVSVYSRYYITLLSEVLGYGTIADYHCCVLIGGDRDRSVSGAMWGEGRLLLSPQFRPVARGRLNPHVHMPEPVLVPERNGRRSRSWRHNP